MACAHCHPRLLPASLFLYLLLLLGADAALSAELPNQEPHHNAVPQLLCSLSSICFPHSLWDFFCSPAILFLCPCDTLAFSLLLILYSFSILNTSTHSEMLLLPAFLLGPGQAIPI
uniref:ACAH3104 n=2 Tax=Homininae TaxID=207598 RepID=Q6UY24_HUMAN|nr:ACAH3104 [Homo sapiens]